MITVPASKVFEFGPRLLRSGLGLTISIFMLYGASASAESLETVADTATNKIASKKVQKAKKSKFSGAWKLQLRAENFEEEPELAASQSFSDVRVALKSKFNYKLMPKLKFKLSTRLRWVSGSVQLNNESDYSDSLVKVYEAVADYKPYTFLGFQAGLVNQKFLNSPLLMGNRSFPGISETLKYDYKNLTLKFKAQQTQPSFQAYDSDRTGNEKQPYFMTETLELKAHYKNRIRGKVFATHYAYKNLPSVVARVSGELGNTITDIADPRFVTEFDGFVTGAELCFCEEDNYRLSLRHQILANSKVSQNDSGRLTQLALAKTMGSFELEFNAEDYFKDRDVVPAVYSNLRYGGNNRKGQSYGVALTFRDYGFKVFGQFYNAELISQVQETVRGDLSSYYFGMEMLYVNF